MAFAIGLPADLAITDRSRKFYDGTYRWNSKGFTDEQGGTCRLRLSIILAETTTVYHDFDCLDPLGRAPTPMPPVFSDDEDDDWLDVTTSKPADVLGKDTDATSATTAVDSETLCLKPNGDIVTDPNLRGPRSPGSIRRFAIRFLTNSERSKIARQDKPGAKPQKSNAIISKPEGIVPASKHTELEGALTTNHDLHLKPPRAKMKNNDVKMPDTPPESPINAVTGAPAISPASTLSSVPSNLSEQGKDFDIKVCTANCIEYSTTDCCRSKQPLQPRKNPQARPVPHPRPQLDRERRPRLAAWLRKSQRVPKEPFRASPAYQSERRTASRGSHCESCTPWALRAAAASESQFVRRSRKRFERENMHWGRLIPRNL